MVDLGSSNSTLNILTKNSGVTATMASRIMIDGSGNIGMNTTNPSYTLDVNGKVRHSVNIPGTVNQLGSSTGTLLTFSTTNELTRMYARVLLAGNGGQGSYSKFNIRLAVSTNSGSSYDTGGTYYTAMSQYASGSLTAISQSGYPTIGTNLQGGLWTHSINITVSKCLGDLGYGSPSGHVIDVTLNGMIDGNIPYKNSGTIVYGAATAAITNVRLTLEGQTNSLGGQMYYAVDSVSMT